jgi:hypothetical protein
MLLNPSKLDLKDAISAQIFYMAIIREFLLGTLTNFERKKGLAGIEQEYNALDSLWNVMDKALWLNENDVDANYLEQWIDLKSHVYYFSFII